MNGRVYDPTTGRFLSADPFVSQPFNSQSFNRYSYVENNPLSRIDPSGFAAQNLSSAVTGIDILEPIPQTPIPEGNPLADTHYEPPTISPGYGIGFNGMMGIAGGFNDKLSIRNYLARMGSAALYDPVPTSAPPASKSTPLPQLGADRNYDQTARTYHHYDVLSDPICSLGQRGCTPALVFEALRRYPAPGWDPAFLVSDFDTTDVTPWSWESNTVYHLVDAKALTVYNITTSDHFLRYGEVQRSVVVQSDVIRIRTVGVGNNISVGRKKLNMYLGPEIFEPLDDKIRDYVTLHLPGG